MLCVPAIFLAISGTATASEQTDSLKQLVDGLANGRVDDRLTDAFIENRLKNRVGDVGVWVDYRHVELEDDRTLSAKNSDNNSRSVGFDYQLSSRVSVGLALFDQATKTSSEPSNDSAEGYSEISDDTQGIGFNGRYLLNSGLIVDGSVTYLATDTDITDYSNLAPPSKKTTSSDNVILDIGTSALMPLSSDLLAKGRVGFAYQKGDQSSYRDEYNRYHDGQEYENGTVTLNTNIHYQAAQTVMPYAGIQLGYDVISDVASPAFVTNPGGSIATSVPYQEKRDRFSYGLRAGVIWKVADNFTVDAGYQRQQWGSEIHTDTLGIHLRRVF